MDVQALASTIIKDNLGIMQSDVAYNVVNVRVCSKDCYSQVSISAFLCTLNLYGIRASTLETEAEDERDETMTHSLIIAHQCTVDTLQRLEEEVQQQPTEGDLVSPPLTPGSPPLGRVVRAPAGHKPSRSFDNQNIRFPAPAKDLASKRASVWINNLIFDNSPLPLGFRRQTWGDAECALFLDQQPYYFLQKWTDQGEHLNELRRTSIEHPIGHGVQEDSTNEKDEETTLLLNSATNSQTEYRQQNPSTGAWNFGSVPEISTSQSNPRGTGGMCSAAFRKDCSN